MSVDVSTFNPESVPFRVSFVGFFCDMRVLNKVCLLAFERKAMVEKGIFAAVVPELEYILDESVKITADILRKAPPDASTEPLVPCEALALVIYTFDIRMSLMSVDPTGEGNDNFFVQLNVVLQKRNALPPAVLVQLQPYMYYCFCAMRKLKKLSDITTYRGVPTTASAVVAANYVGGTMVHWSGFTSTSRNLSVAQGFARAGGIIFRIQVFDGRCIKDFSAVRAEDEVLLSPNTKLMVIKGMTLDVASGYYYVDLVQSVDADFIF